jgi:hypothetical protein
MEAEEVSLLCKHAQVQQLVIASNGGHVPSSNFIRTELHSLVVSRPHIVRREVPVRIRGGIDIFVRVRGRFVTFEKPAGTVIYSIYIIQSLLSPKNARIFSPRCRQAKDSARSTPGQYRQQHDGGARMDHDGLCVPCRQLVQPRTFTKCQRKMCELPALTPKKGRNVAPPKNHWMKE